MTVADQIKILDDRIKSTQAQYDLGREDAKISVFSSKNRLDQYEYLTGEDLGYKPKVFEKVMSVTNNTQRKTNANKVYNKNKHGKYFFYNSQHSFAKFKDINEFNELSPHSLYKRLNDFKKRFTTQNT